MILKKDIVLDNNPRLRKECQEVNLPLSKEDEKTLDEMMEYLINSQDEIKAKEYDLQPGVGLAAPQIGLLKRMFCVYAEDEKGNIHKYALVNPKIISTSVTKCYLAGGEGCLSVKENHDGYIKRYSKIKLSAYDHISKKDVTLTLRDYIAIVVQHEYDHLSGILYYDRINKLNPFDVSDNAKAI